MSKKVLHQHELSPKIAVVEGTRPGIIKFSPVIRELTRRGADFFIIHTGQHYSFNMDRQFFDDLELPYPRYVAEKTRECNLHGAQTAEMMCFIEEVLLAERPQVVVVGGDANTNLAGALAARKLMGIKVAHMEAGLRSDDWRMPEEHNRVIIDHISEILFAPTELNRQNLIRDNVKGRIVVTGNPIVDAVQENLELALKKSKLAGDLGLEGMPYCLLTFHREENVDDRENFSRFLTIMPAIAEIFLQGVIVFPIHPRTRKRLQEWGWEGRLTSIPRLLVLDPVGYLDMLALLRGAQLVFTDSGGLQEESCILQVPCLTLRDNTERPETVEVGANRVVGLDLAAIREGMEYFRQTAKDWLNPLGDGRAAKRIVAELMEEAGQDTAGTLI
jgi:UDP-N-acetylglucosamine 2-epimerase (non-hydrolysing)